MNKIYRLIWNATARLWQVAGELGRQGRKRTGGRRLVAAGSLYLLPLAALGGELPSGGTVVTGVGSIEQFDKHLSITQGSERLAIEWQQFNIGAGNRVSFNQPSASAIALNRVIGTDGSRIMGQLDANGRVFLINPNGVLFGKNAQVDVGGLVASTLDISNEDFAAGNYRFRGNGNNAAIINKGHITAADGGAVALLGGHVSNEGVISARLGSVALVAGEQVTLDFAGDGLLKVQIDEATRDALVENHQLIQADGGQVLMSAHAADALLQTVVNNTGVIEARTLENRNGKIVLLGGFEGGTVEVAGKLDASAPEGGDGGFIDTSGAYVQIHEGLEVTTLAVDGRTGDWLIDPTDLTISAGSAPQTDSGIGAETLSANLENNNVTLQTVAEGSETGNIYVNGEVSWDAATTLTLSAHGDIHINQNISATTGKLALEYGQADVAAGNTADYHVNARVNLSAGQNFSTRLGSDGDVLEYTVITELGAEGSTSGTDLQGMQGNLNGLYALGADINASATESWDGGAGFNPIGDYSNSNGFTGVFDGLGHLITGLTINRPSQDDVGLFGYTKGAWLRNIGLQRGRVVGRDSVGSLVGMNQGAISQSWASVAVNGASTVGGLVGWNRNAGGSGEINHGTINESYAVGPVSGNIMYVGGLVGYNAWQISNSYATGVVSGNEYVGGLVGENFGTITNTYATGAVSGSDSVGGLVGAAAYGDIAESYWNTETTGQTSSAGGGTGLTTAELIEALPVGFDPEVWDNAGNQTTPYLLGLSGNQVFNKNDLPSGTISASNRPVLYTVIQDVHQLQAMKDALGERYVLGNDIDASATVSWNAGAGFAPIKIFNGTLDGLGYAIHGLTIYRPSADEVGLFGVTGGSAVLRNIRLEDINVTGRNQVGGLVGRSGGSIENAHTSGTVSGNGQVGGLVGAQARNLSKITGSSSMADVSGTGDSIGGLVGTTASAVLVTIQDSHAGGAVSGGSQVGGLVGWTNRTTISNAFATGAVSGGTKVGGLVGWAFDQSSISNAFATGAVSGGTEVGGLVGYSEGEIRDSYATGTVTGADKVGGLVGLSIKEIRDSHAAGTVTGKNQVGGLVGHAVWSSSISNSYATGDVTGEDMVGGLVGQSEADSASTASISNSHASGTVSGNEAVGGLVGWNEKLITDSTASGAVTGDSEVGGLVGTNAEHFSGVYGRIEKSSASGDVTGTGRAVGGLAGVNAGRIDDSYASGAVHGRTKVGGLVGWGTRASSDGELRVTGSYATGDVTGTDYDVGGLVGASSRMLISHSFATGAVSGASRVGGLVGLNSGPYYNGNRIEYSFATGTVSGTGNAIGGLVGSNDAYIYRSYAEGTVQGNGNVGGLVGEHRDDRRMLPEDVDPLGVIEQSFATGAVNGSGSNIGGLVGDNRAIIRQSYASGAVSGDSNVGGLVGQQAQLTSSLGMVEQSYASGAVSGGSNVGGLVGHDDGGAGVVESFWDQEATGQTTSVGGTGLSSAQMRELASFAGWSIDDQGGTDSVWRIYEGHTAPLLRAFLTPFEVDVDAVTTTYNGGNHRALNSDQLSYDTPTLDLFTGELGYLASSRNVGTYSGADLRLVGLYSSQQGYDIIANGELTINPAELTITSTDVIKTYDGSTGAAGTAHVMAGALYGTDTLSGGVFTFTDKNVGIGTKTVTVSDVTVDDGNGGANYTITYEDNTTSTINPFVINLSGSRVYDGGVDVEADVLTLGSLVGDETLSLSGTGFMADKHVGDGKVFQLGSLSLGDGDQGGLASNYTLEGGSHSVTITPAQLRISTSDIIKTYDGTTDAAGTAVAVAGTKLFDADSLIGGTFAFTDKNAGVGNKTVTVSDVTVDDGNGGANYTVTYEDNTTSTISPRPVEVTANAQTKTYGDYDPELNFTVEEASSGRGLLAEDSLSGALSRDAGEDVGRYAITQGTLGNSNYDISFIGTELSIDPRAITLAADLVSKIYGEADPTLSVQIAEGNLAFSDTLADVAGELSRAAGNNVGSYNVILGEGTKAGNYRITFDADNKAFSITPRPITITALNQSKIYGDSDPTLSYTAEAQSTGRGLLAGDTLNGTLSRAEGENVGRYAITQGTLANSNYAISFSEAELSIDPRAIKLAAEAVSKIYGEADPTLSVRITGGSLGAEAVSDTLADVTGELSRAAGRDVGSYDVVLGDSAKAGNYLITFDADNKAFSITPRPVTVAAHNHNKTYGDFDPTLSYTVEAQSVGRGLLAGDSLNGELSRVAGEDVGTYAIGQGSLANSNYDISFSGAELSIDPRAITLAADLVSKIYGEADPTFSVQIVGGSLGSETVSDTLADVTGSLRREDGENVGDYSVLLGSGAKAGNYFITFDTDNKAVSITPRPVVVTANAQTKTYGDFDPTLSYSTEAQSVGRGLLAGDSLSGALSRAEGEDVGRYAITQGTLANSNYVISFTGADLTIDPRAIALAADLVSKIYGEADPALSVRITGGSLGSQVVSDTLEDVTGKLSRAAGRDVGSYDVVLGDSAKAGNYLITFDADNKAFSITPRPVTVAAHNHNKTYGDFDPTLSYTVEAQSVGRGLLAGDSLNGELSRVAGEDVGTYAIGQGSLANSNYDISFSGAELSIDPRAITLAADLVSKIYGEADPTLSVQIAEGNLAFSDTLADVAGELSRAAGNNVGSYNVILGEGTKAGNYRITFDADNKAFSITPRPITITALDRSKIYGEADPTLSVQIAEGNLAFSDTLADVAGELSRAAGNNVGSYNVILGEGTKADNYRITFDADNKAFSITPRPITITALDRSKIYGDSDPTLIYTAEARSTGRGLVEGDTFSGELSRDVGEDVNRYTITQGSLNNSNYDISFIGAELQIDPRTIKLAAEAVSKIYGEADPTLSVRITGGSLGSETVNDTLADVTGDLSRAVGSDVGSYNVLLGEGTKAGNYLITFDAENKAFSIMPRPVVVTANAQRKTYGDYDPALSYTAEAQSAGSGLLVGESLSGTLSRAAGENVGTYAIGQGTLTDANNGNYEISFTGAELSIDPRTITLAADLVRKVYGEADPALSVQITGGSLGSETVNDTLADVIGDLSRAAGNDVGSYNVALGEGTKAGNYLITFDADNKAFTITPRPVVVTAKAQTKTYGDYDPALSYTAESQSAGRGLLEGDSLSGELRRAAGENVGRYAITQGTLANSNYDISFSGAELSIDPRAITLAADVVSKIYGEADPTFSVQIVGGNLGSETVSDTLADVTGSLRREDGENVGDYSVLLGSGAKAGNYFITFDTDNKAVSITPRPVTVAAHNHSKAYGDFDPTLSYTVEAQSVGRGLLAGDSLNGELSRVAGEDVGTYAIGQGSLANSNYDISFSGAELSIDPRAITLAADLVSKIYGEGDPTLSVRIIGGSLGSETVSDTLADVTGDLSRAAGSDVGSYNVLLGEGAKADNYLITFDVDNQAFTITPRSIRVTADDQHKYQGEADPVFTWHYDASALVSGDKAETLFSGSLARAMGEEPGIYTINLGSLQSGSNYTIDFVPGELQIEAAGIVRRLGDRGKSYQDALVVALQSAAQAGPGPASNIGFELTAPSEPGESDGSDDPITGFAFGMSQASDGVSVVQGLYSIVNGGLRLPEGFDEQ